jgi:hypothetical protein
VTPNTLAAQLDEFARAAADADLDAASVEAAVSLGLSVFAHVRASAERAGPLGDWREAAPELLDAYRRWHDGAGRLLQAVRLRKARGVRLTDEGPFVRAYMEAGRVVHDFDRAADLVAGRARGPGVPLDEAVDGLRDRTVRGGA